MKEIEAATVRYDILMQQDLYVERLTLQKEITDIVSRKEETRQYYIMYGAKDVGKSSTVERVVEDMKGVMMLRGTSSDTRDGMLQQLASIIRIDVLRPQNSDFVNSLAKSMSSEGILPTTIVEFENWGGLEGVYAARNIAKNLCDFHNFTIVFAEANYVQEFHQGRYKVNYIFVDELSESEAREYMKKLKSVLSDEDIKHVIDNIGTNPGALRRMRSQINGGQSVTDFVAMKLVEARQDFVAFPHKQILKAFEEHPEGVSPTYFHDTRYKEVDLCNPRNAGPAMMQSNAIAYDMELGRCIILTRAHHTALRSYTSVV